MSVAISSIVESSNNFCLYALDFVPCIYNIFAHKKSNEKKNVFRKLLMAEVSKRAEPITTSKVRKTYNLSKIYLLEKKHNQNIRILCNEVEFDF